MSRLKSATSTLLRAGILNALAGSSSQQPVDTEKLYPLAKSFCPGTGGTRKQIETALMELYQAREVFCCKIIKPALSKVEGGGQESVVWWLIGGQRALPSYGITGTPRIKPARVAA